MNVNVVSKYTGLFGEGFPELSSKYVTVRMVTNPGRQHHSPLFLLVIQPERKRALAEIDGNITIKSVYGGD